MKRTERKHLKENPLAVWLSFCLDSIRSRRFVIITVCSIVGISLVVGLFYGWDRWNSHRADELLAVAMAVVDAPVASESENNDTEATAGVAAGFTSLSEKREAAIPKLLAVANAYPGLSQGLTARYQAAIMLVALGRANEASHEYERLNVLNADGIYGRMARLGRAEVHMETGEYSAAIDLLEEETTTGNVNVPLDGVLMRLGQAYQLADRSSEALVVFYRVVEEFPGSTYRFDAEREIDTIEVDR